ncbi:MAG TPA: chromosome segregation protein SMC, partial [Candidimonas sp.]|nr:chromosome segregation protein SMC [Candidimonas sp.]
MEIQSGEENPRDIFAEWFTERPKWMQTAAGRLATARRMPAAETVRDLVDLCVVEANGGEAVFETMPHGIFGSATGTPPFRLRKLSQVVGVNAIRENACLDFGSVNLSVVFGMNGSGKSGYARLLKHTCGARHKLDLLPNVFGAAKVSPACEVTVETGADSKTFEWNAEPDGIVQLRSVHIFDSTAAESYVDSKNLASYEPRRMRFLSALIQTCDAVAAELANRKLALPKAFPTVPTEHALTKAAIFVSQLRGTTKVEDLDAACVWSTEDLEHRHSIEKSLRQHDTTARTKQLELEKRTLSLFVQSYEALKFSVSDAQAANLLNLKQAAATKRKAASEDAAKVFAGSALEGIGSVSWRLMWDEARRYSEEAAYPGKTFPAADVDDLCVLCHQPLDDNAKKRLAGFETFVKSGLEAAAAKAEKDYRDAVATLPSLPARDKWDLDIDFLKVDPTVGKALYESVLARLLAITAIEILDGLPPVDWNAVDVAVASMVDTQAKETAALAELTKDGKKAELETELKELK